MIIDFHSHLYPKALQYDPAVLPSIFDVEGLVRHMAEAGVTAKVVSNPLIYPPDRGVDVFSLEWIRRYNDFIGEVTARYPGRIYGLAATVPWGGEPYLKEAERAVKTYGLLGLSVSSSFRGKYLDSPEVAECFAQAEELDIPVFVHPQSITVGADLMREFRLIELVGRPFDTTVSIARMVFAGMLERFPRLRLVLAHVGGATALLLGRLDMGYELRTDPGMGPPWGPDRLSRPPSESLRRLYVDTMCLHAPAIRAAIDTFGIDHVVFGTDYPPVTISAERHLTAVRALGLPPTGEAKVLAENAARLLKL